jgi:hypothetical protein
MTATEEALRADLKRERDRYQRIFAAANDLLKQVPDGPIQKQLVHNLCAAILEKP